MRITEEMVPLQHRIFTIEATLSVEMMKNYIQPKMELKKKEYKERIDIEFKKAIHHYENIPKMSTQVHCFSSFYLPVRLSRWNSRYHISNTYNK